MGCSGGGFGGGDGGRGEGWGGQVRSNELDEGGLSWRAFKEARVDARFTGRHMRDGLQVLESDTIIARVVNHQICLWQGSNNRWG